MEEPLFYLELWGMGGISTANSFNLQSTSVHQYT